MNTCTHLAVIWPVTCHTDHVGKNSTFVAIKGAMHDGVQFIPLALQKGAKTIVAECTADIPQEILDAIQDAGADLEFVPDARRALALRAAKAWGNPAQKLKIIGITGTKGKTTSSWLLHHLLQSAGKKTALLSTAGNKIGNQNFETQLTTQHPDYLHAFFYTCLATGVEYVVLEVAAQALTLHRVAGLEFDAIIFTNFAQAHGEFYATEQEYFAAKAAIFEQAKPDTVLVINADDEKGAKFLEKYKDQNITAFAINLSTARPVYAKASPGDASLGPLVLSSPKGHHEFTLSLSKGHMARAIQMMIGQIYANSAAGLTGSLQTELECFEFSCPALIGVFNLYNILAASTMAWRLSISLADITHALATFAGLPGRLEKYQLSNGAISFIDYAHNPLSFASVLPLLRSLTDHLIVVAGAGGDRDKAMRPVMGQLMAHYADHVILTTDNPRSEQASDIITAILNGVPQEQKHKIICELDREQAIKCAYELSKPTSIIALLGKGPDEYQIVGTEKIYFSEKAILKNL